MEWAFTLENQETYDAVIVTVPNGANPPLVGDTFT